MGGRGSDADVEVHGVAAADVHERVDLGHKAAQAAESRRLSGPKSARSSPKMRRLQDMLLNADQNGSQLQNKIIWKSEALHGI